jgi:DNA-binding winged-HTH domains
MDPKTTVYYFDDIVAEPGVCKISKAGQTVQLEPKSFEVLAFLIENRGRLIEKDELLNAVWKDAFVTQNAMTRVIAQLRKALGDDAKVARYIETVPTRGYRFIASVHFKTDPEFVDRVETSIADLTKNDQVAKSAPRRFTLTQIIAMVSLTGVILIAAIVIWRVTSHSETTGSGGVIRTTQITTWTGLDIFPAISPDGNSIAYSSDHQGSSKSTSSH